VVPRRRCRLRGHRPHNAGDFEGARRFGVSVVTPGTFLAWLEERA
jgi:hypothetical protein